MRLFIAVWVNEEIREAVLDLLGRLSLQAEGVKWTPREQLHFTLKFLGEQRPELVKDLLPVLEEAGRQEPVFSLSLGRGGVFPAWQNPRILWLGPDQGEKELYSLAHKISQGITDNRLLPDERAKENRSFSPHLTIGRVKSPAPQFDRALLTAGVQGRMTVDGFSLVESILTPKGPVYKEVQRFSLLEARH